MKQRALTFRVENPLTDSARQDQRDIARGAGANFLGFLIKLGARAPFLFIAGTLYGSHAFGRYVIVIAVIDTLSGISTFGLKRSLFKFLDDDVVHDKSACCHATISAALLLAVGVASIFGLALFLSADLVARLTNLSADDSLPLRLLSPIIPLVAFVDVALAATRFRRTVRFEVLARSICEPTTLMLSALAFYFLGQQQFGLFYASGLSILAALVVALTGFGKLYSFRFLVPHPDTLHRVRGMIRFTAPTGLSDLLTILLFRMDVFVISYFCTSAQLGIYGMAQQFATSVQKVHESFNPIVAPVISTLIARGSVQGVRDQLAQVSRWIFSLQLVIVIGMAFFGDLLLSVLGSGYAVGGVALTLLVVAEMLNGSFGVCDLPLLFRRPIINPIVTTFGLLLQGLLCWTLVPKLGINGAALSLCLTYFMMNAARILMLRLLFRVLVLEWALLRTLLAGALCAVAIGFYRRHFPFSEWILVTIGIPLMFAIYGGLMMAFGLKARERGLLAARYPALGRLFRIAPIT